MPQKVKDLTEVRFSRLTVRWPIGRDRRGSIVWLCSCACGRLKTIASRHLLDGATKACGCLNRLHGQSRTPLHHIWTAMLQRCSNPNSQNYHRYGGRGIRVCERWMDFKNFALDMGPRPKGLTLDRINNDGNYEPLNCRWTTMAAQTANRSPRPKETYLPRNHPRRLSRISE